MAQALDALLTNLTDVEKKVRDIHAIEHYGDKLTHEIMRELNETFVTPLDREDIIGLASKIDDVTDVSYDVAELVQIYKVGEVRPSATRQTTALVAAANEMVVMINSLEGLKDLEPHARELGSERELEGILQILRRGNGADRQLRVYNANKDIVEVVREIAEATEAGGIA